MATGTTGVRTVDVVTPAAGESVTEGTILEWHVKVGDTIKLDETIVEISTDKVDVELPSPAAGTVSELLVAEGDTVTVGQVIARISVEDGAGHDDAPSEPTGATNGGPSDGASGSTDGAGADGAGGNGGSGDVPPAASDSEAGKLVDVVTPAAGESVTEGTILEWRRKVGEAIERDETIVEISTDKVDVELPSPSSGTVAEILVAEGDTVTVGQVIARIAVGRDGATAERPSTPGPGTSAADGPSDQTGPPPAGGEAARRGSRRGEGVTGGRTGRRRQGRGPRARIREWPFGPDHQVRRTRRRRSPLRQRRGHTPGPRCGS